MWGIVKLNTINVITTATEFGEIRNSLGASLLMTCKEMKLWQGQKGCKRRGVGEEGGEEVKWERMYGRKCSPGWHTVSWRASSIGLWPLRVKELNKASFIWQHCFLFFVSLSLCVFLPLFLPVCLISLAIHHGEIEVESQSAHARILLLGLLLTRYSRSPWARASIN